MKEMEAKIKKFEAILRDKHITPSYQRLKILFYLADEHRHPSAEQIYHALHEDIPSLSKTTVYNTLKLFIEAGLVHNISTEESEGRYEMITTEHGHFKCNVCGSIYNFAIQMDHLAQGELDQFEIQDRNVYFRGICPKCRSNIKSEKNEGGS